MGARRQLPGVGGIQAQVQALAGDRRAELGVFVTRQHATGGVEAAFLLQLAVAHAAGIHTGAHLPLVRATAPGQAQRRTPGRLAGGGGVQRRVLVGLQRVEVFGAVAVDGVAPAVAGIGQGLQAAAGTQLLAEVEGRLGQSVLGAVRVGEHGAARCGIHVGHGIPVVQRHAGQQAVAHQGGAATEHAHAPVGAAVTAADARQHQRLLAGGMVAPAVLVEHRAAHIAVPAIGMALAQAHLGALAAVAAEAQLGAQALGAAAVHRLQHDGAAQGVQAEAGVGPRQHGQRLQRELRHHVPVDDIAEGLVDAHAVQVHRQPLRRTQQPRRAVAAVGQVGLERAALDVVDLHARHAAGQVVGHVVALGLVERAAAHGLAGVGQQVAIDAQAGQGRGADHLHLLGGCGGLGRHLGEPDG